MLPIIPYSGMLRPVLMALVIVLTYIVLRRLRNKPHYKALLLFYCIGYAFFLVYTTFLSRSVSQTYSYRLQLMGSARSAITVDGGTLAGLWSLIGGDFSGFMNSVHVDSLQSLEGIFINVLLMMPVGYLLPMAAEVRATKPRFRHVLIFTMLLSGLIEIVQLITKLGMLDIDDWVFNVLGAMLGYGLYYKGCKQMRRTEKKDR